jgi:hypothetical protein
MARTKHEDEDLVGRRKNFKVNSNDFKYIQHMLRRFVKT